LQQPLRGTDSAGSISDASCEQQWTYYPPRNQGR
jgi:hypothetical protein